LSGTVKVHSEVAIVRSKSRTRRKERKDANRTLSLKKKT